MILKILRNHFDFEVNENDFKVELNKKIFKTIIERNKPNEIVDYYDLIDKDVELTRLNEETRKLFDSYYEFDYLILLYFRNHS